jgi:Holliday junction resolvasome RuvABC endonuclease subunit
LTSPAFLFLLEDDFIKILAIDQARNGAWSVFDYETKTLEAYGVFSFNNKDYTYAKAIRAIEELVDSLIKTYDISAVFIEDIQLRVNVQSFKKLAQLQGVLINLFEKNEYLYDFVAPTQWQNYCKARGRSSKEIKEKIKALELSGKKESKILSIQFVKEKFNVDTDNDNLSDAICIGYYAVNHFKLKGETVDGKKE